jgi:microcystin-dependent protein
MPAYIEPALVSTNDIITSTDANARRQATQFFRQLLPDPDSNGQFLVSQAGGSNGTADWVDGDDAVTAALGYAPIAPAGGSMTGDLKFAAGKGILLDTAGSPGRLFDVTGFTALAARANILRIYNAAISIAMMEITPTAVTLQGALSANGLTVAGTSTTVGDATVSEDFGVGGDASVNGDLAVGGGLTALTGVINGLLQVLNLAVAGTSQAAVFTSTQATGTPPMSVSSTTRVANFNADMVDGAHASATPGAGVIPIADGTGHIPPGFIPATVGAPLIGEIRAYSGASMSAPNAAGWYLCDGSAKSRTAFVSLFSVVGTTFGAGDGSTTFNLPDLRGKFPMGVSGSHALGTTGGAETVDLTHAHSGASLGIGGNTGGPSAVDGIGNGGGTSAPTPGHTHGAGTLDVSGNTDNQAGQSAVSILPPYQAVNFIIYAGV